MIKRIRLIYYLSIISFYIFCASVLMGMSTLLTFFACIFIIPYALYSISNQNQKSFWFLLLFLVIGSLLNLVISKNGIGGTIVILGVLFLSKFIVENTKIMRLHILFFLIFFISTTFYQIFVLKIDPNDFYKDMSRNYLGLILVLYNTLYSFLLYKDKKKINIIITFISVVLSMNLFGRSSIGAMIVLFFLNFIFYLKNKNICISTSIIICSFLMISYLFFEDIQNLYSISSFSSYGIETPRYELWQDFIQKISLGTFIWGIDVYSISSIAAYNGNIHNDFLNLLARTGIGFIAVIFVLFYSLFLYTCKKDFYSIVLLIIICFRIFFDTGIFVNNLGLCIYPLLLYPILTPIKINKKNEYSSFNVHNEQK